MFTLNCTVGKPWGGGQIDGHPPGPFLYKGTLLGTPNREPQEYNGI